MMNPKMILQLKTMLTKFRQNHPKVPLFFRADAGKVLDKTRKLCYPYNKNIVELHRFSIWHQRLNRKEGAIWKIHWLSIKTRSFISMR